MTEKLNPVARIAELELTAFERGSAYRSADAGIAGRIGLTQLGAVYSEVPPGKSGCPFHVHHVEEEMFVILEGEGVYRFGPDSYQIKAGDVLGSARRAARRAGICAQADEHRHGAAEVSQYLDTGRHRNLRVSRQRKVPGQHPQTRRAKQPLQIRRPYGKQRGLLGRRRVRRLTLTSC